MVRKRNKNKDRNERREEALRPSPFLGYDRDKLGMHFLSREAYEFAESQFRRAHWLNPNEPYFTAHLAWSLFKQGKIGEAQALLKGLSQEKLDENAKSMMRAIEEASEDGKGGQ